MDCHQGKSRESIEESSVFSSVSVYLTCAFSGLYFLDWACTLHLPYILLKVLIMEYILLGITFLPAYFLLSITPGLNMLTAMNIASAIGLSKTISFMVGASLAVAIIAILSIFGVVTIMEKTPEVFNYMKYAGALFLCYIGINFWRDKGGVGSASDFSDTKYSQINLFTKGLFTGLLNPKGWLFFAAFLPTFLNQNLSVFTQVLFIVVIVASVELFCMATYAIGGITIKTLITTRRNLLVLNRVNAIVMFVLAGILIRY